MSPARTRRPAGLTARAHRQLLSAATVLAVAATSLAGALPASADPGTDPTAVVAVADATTAPAADPAPVVAPAEDEPAADALTAGTASITGTTQVGAVLTAVTTGWPEGATLALEWLRGDEVVGTEGTYTLTPADLGATLALRVTATAEGLEPVSGTSEPTGPVTVGTLTTAVPTLSGTVRVGSAVTAVPGAWSEGTTLAYQWRVDGAAVAGATSATFTPTATHLGKALSVVVTGTQTGYATATKASTATKVGAGALTAATPTISGTVRVGSKVTAVRGTWSPAPAYTYQWRADGAAIKGATSSTYTIPATLRGKKLSVSVTGKKTGYSTTSVTSAATAVTATFTTAPTPKVTGTARIGSTLKVTAGTWKPAPTLSYQWKRNGTAIAGATKTSYKLTTADHGQTITVTVTAKRSTYVTTTRTSKPTAKVDVPAATITKNGTFKVGTTIPTGTYISSTTASWCEWELRTNTGTSETGLRGWNLGAGRHVVTITSADKYFRTSGCGTWTRRVDVGATLTKTGANGMYVIGTGPGDLRPGTYRTTGGVKGAECYIAALGDFSGSDASVLESYTGAVPDQVPDEILLDAGLAGFQTQNCVWTRVPD